MNNENVFYITITLLFFFLIFQYCNVPNYEHMTNYAYPSYYPAFYYYKTNDVWSQTDKCAPIFVNPLCVKYQLHKNNGNLPMSLSNCNSHTPTSQNQFYHKYPFSLLKSSS